MDHPLPALSTFAGRVLSAQPLQPALSIAPVRDRSPRARPAPRAGGLEPPAGCSILSGVTASHRIATEPLLSGANRFRLIAAAALLPCVAVLLVAASLTPDPAGTGTHRQLGLPPCGMLAATGLPCATCGMTTAFSYTAHGELWSALVTQPAGATLAVLTAMAIPTLGYAVVTGAALGPLARALLRPRTALLLAVLVMAGWAYTLSVALIY